MSMESTIHLGRKAYAKVRLDECIISRPSNAPVFDPITGNYTVPAGTPIYEGECRFLRRAGVPQVVSAGAQALQLPDNWIEVPWDEGSFIEANDICIVTDSADAHLVGRPMRVTDVHNDTTIMVRRCTLEDTVAA